MFLLICIKPCTNATYYLEAGTADICALHYYNGFFYCSVFAINAVVFKSTILVYIIKVHIFANIGGHMGFEIYPSTWIIEVSISSKTWI